MVKATARRGANSGRTIALAVLCRNWQASPREERQCLPFWFV
jgi:hypothetical protein